MVSSRLLVVIGVACATAAIMLSGIGSGAIVDFVAYRHFAYASLLATIPVALAIAAVVIAAVALRLSPSVLKWLLMALAVISLVVSAIPVAGAVSIGMPLRTGSGGLVGIAAGTRVPIDSKWSAAVPVGWVGERSNSGDRIDYVTMAPLGDTFPGMADLFAGSNVVRFVYLQGNADAERALELLAGDAEVITMSSEGMSLKAVVRRGFSTPGVKDVVDTIDLATPGGSRTLISGSFVQAELPDDAMSDDAAFLRWFIRFIDLES